MQAFCATKKASHFSARKDLAKTDPASSASPARLQIDFRAPRRPVRTSTQSVWPTDDRHLVAGEHVRELDQQRPEIIKQDPPR